MAFVYSSAVVFGLTGRLFFWELVTLIDIMLLGQVIVAINAKLLRVNKMVYAKLWMDTRDHVYYILVCRHPGGCKWSVRE